MKKHILLAIIVGLTSYNLYCQSFSVTGNIVDTTSQPMVGATVVLLNAKDSVLTSFGITGGKGQFVLYNVTPNDYILQVTFLGYQNYSKNYTLKPTGKEMSIGIITLKPKTELMDEVVVKAEHIPIQIKKDTIEYNAGAFRVQPNAPVEDLLKKLPGVEVDRDGNIKAQGENVSKVLVDGKEFFGDDPKIATKNLPADAVNKVQVFDKKSETAEFTGIDDGEEQKTINIKLKGAH